MTQINRDFVPLPDQTDRRRNNVLDLSVLSSVRPSVRSSVTRLGQGHEMIKFGVKRSNVKVIRDRRQVWRPGGGIIFHPVGLFSLIF